MPKATFTDSENQLYELVPAGDYFFEVASVEFGIQQGGKTAGSETMTLHMTIYSDLFVTPRSSIRELVIFHPSCLWKIDTFAKSSNLLIDGKPPIKGQEIEYTEGNVLGLRGTCAIKIDTYKRAEGTEGRSNRIAVFYTNKPKHKRGHYVLPEDEPLPF